MTDERLLYDLAGADDDHRFSPYCWRIRLALAHKGLAVQTVPWRFTEKDAIAVSGQGRVPVLVDGETTVSDSWAIAVYLEDTYPDRPSLFGGAAGRALARFVNTWADRVVLGGMAHLIVPEVYRHLHEKDRDYFRTSREKAFAAPLEQIAGDIDARIAAFRQALDPLRATLRAQPYLCGDAAAYADYAVFGAFQWARCVSDLALLADDDPVADWRERVAASFDGMAANAHRPDEIKSSAP